MNTLAESYRRLRIAVVGDYCLDRYMEIDPTRQERSIETGRIVHNVSRVRSQPGAAGTIVNNLVALGVGQIDVVGVLGVDGEGFELRRALAGLPGVRLDSLVEAESRRTFTYCKPLVVHDHQPPEELERLDSKNWTPTPIEVQERIIDDLESLASLVDALILMDQVDVPETGVITQRVLEAIGSISRKLPERLIIADSRRGLAGFPPMIFKMNRNELQTMIGSDRVLGLAEVGESALALAARLQRPIIVTLAEQGLLGASSDGHLEHLAPLLIRGPIDIVGAGDAVTANLTAALASGATLRRALTLANAAASVVIHQLGTSGAATLDQIEQVLHSADSV